MFIRSPASVLQDLALPYRVNCPFGWRFGAGRGSVRDPDQVDVSYDPQQDRLIIEVASKDRGVLIGRGGRTLRALEDALSLSRHYAGQTSANANTDLPLIEITTARRDSSD